MGNLRDVARRVEARSGGKLARATVVRMLPLYGGAFAARFGMLPMDAIRAIEQQAEAGMDDDASLDLTAGFVADACRQLYAREGGGLEALTHDDGSPVRFDEQFAEVLGLEPIPGRDAFEGSHDVVLACWVVEDPEGGERMLNVPAVNAYSIELLEWMQDTTRRVEGEVVGESNGTLKS